MSDIVTGDPGSVPASMPVLPKEKTGGEGEGGRLRRVGRWLHAVVDGAFGVAALWVGLAVLSVLPILNFLSLGYLLEASGRVARSGRWRDGFIGVRQASVLGSMVLGTWLVFWPLKLVASLAADARLVAPDSHVTLFWQAATLLLAVLTVGHVAWACVRGGRLRHFLWPAPVRWVRWLSSPWRMSEMRERLGSFVRGLRLPHYFWLGLRGFLGAGIWLAGPVLTLLAASALPVDQGGFVLSLAGALWLMAVVVYLPFLQAHFAMTRRFGTLFNLRRVRHLFRRAPLAFWVAMLVTVLFALPLYLLKIELTPQEVAWLPSLAFVAFMFPARLMTGWAVHRGARRGRKRALVFRWLGRAGLVPLALVYVLFVYLTQYWSWNGVMSLLEQHAFLVPAPLMNL